MKRLFSTKYSDTGITIAALLMRIGLGCLMLPHGFSKLMNFAVLGQKFSDPLHVGHVISLCLVIFAELFCPVFIILGLFTRAACIPLVISLSFALGYASHWDFFGTGEKATLFLAGFLGLLFIGPGKISFDRLVGK